MIAHLVFFNIGGGDDASEKGSKEANINEAVTRLAALPPLIPEIKCLRVGRDISRTGVSYDVGLYTEFESEKDLDTYRDHPDHQAVVDFIKKVATARAVVDFEF